MNNNIIIIIIIIIIIKKLNRTDQTDQKFINFCYKNLAEVAFPV